MLKILKTTLCAAAAATLLAGCSDVLYPGDGVGTFTGTWDGTEWRGRAYAVLQDDSLTVIGHRPDPQYFYDEYVQAKVRYTGPGTYTIAESAGQLAKITGGDAGYFPPAQGTLVISAFNQATHSVSGTITLHAGSMQPAWNASGSFDAYVYTNFKQVPPAR